MSVPLVEVQHVAKRFGHVQALSDVSFGVDRASLLGLLGDNGAGKSTVIKILSGVYRPDCGHLVWEGKEVAFASPMDAHDRGVATVFQDLAMVDQISIYRNMFLGREREILRGAWPFRWLDRRKAREETRRSIAALGIDIRSADEQVEFLSGGQRQSIAIARAVHFSARFLILDEPTSALSLRQQDMVLNTIDRARTKGLAVIFISHNVNHVLPVADRISVLRHGRTIANLERDEVSLEEISRLIRGTGVASA